MDLGRFGIWTFALDPQPANRARELAAEIESLGYGAIWIPEAVGRDPLVSAAMLLSGTERIAVATGIASIYGRDALAMASGHRALSEWFPGRFLLGLGVSHAPMVEGMRGHTYGPPVTTMRTYLEAMDAAPYMAAAPTAAPERVLAALGPKMLALSASHAQGAHPYNVSPVHTKEARAILGAGPILAPDQKVILETDPARARATAREALTIYMGLPNYVNNFRRLGFEDADFADGGSDRLMDAVFAWGTLDQIVARLHEHLDAGADHVAVNVVTTERGVPPVAAWRELAGALDLT
jgi:probable F420-dependent oxidoreductase